MVPPADLTSSAVAWNRAESLSAGSFTADILKTQWLKPGINREPSSTSLNGTPLGLNLLLKLDLTRFAKLPITFLGPSGTSREGTELPHGKTVG